MNTLKNIFEKKPKFLARKSLKILKKIIPAKVAPKILKKYLEKY